MSTAQSSQHAISSLLSAEDQNIFELLDLATLPESEKNEMLATLSRESVRLALEQLMDDPAVSEDVKKQLETLSETATSPVSLQEEMIRIVPNIIEKAKEEAYAVKMNMCLAYAEQIQKTLEPVIPSEDEKSTLSRVVHDLKTFHDRGDRDKFYQTFQSFREMKRALTYA